jgi:hypothetical protein
LENLVVKGFDIDRDRSFRNIEWVTVVGISGGVPLPDNISRQGGFYNPVPTDVQKVPIGENVDIASRVVRTIVPDDLTVWIDRQH